jgi:hypothetical protein
LARIPTKKVDGIKSTKKMRTHVIRDEIVGFNLPLRNRYTGIKTPVTTVDKIITEKNGQSSQPNNKQEIVKTARKNHRIILLGLLSLTLPP